MKSALFSAQQHASTPHALAYLNSINVTPSTLLDRHYSGDWSGMCIEDQEANAEALREGFRIFSAYMIEGQKIWIITEADRSVTTILLPSEY